MIAYGYVVTEGQLAQLAEFMRRQSGFVAAELEAEARAVGIPSYKIGVLGGPIALRIADRLIQRARKDGTIKRDGRKWIPVAFRAKEGKHAE